MKLQKKMMLPLGVFIGGFSVAVVGLTGCGKKPIDSPPKADANTASSQAARATPPAIPRGPVPQAMPAASALMASNASADEAAGKLTLELRKYVAYTRNIPKNFEDFVAHHPMKYPPAPAGKKYVIEEGKVVVH